MSSRECRPIFVSSDPGVKVYGKAVEVEGLSGQIWLVESAEWLAAGTVSHSGEVIRSWPVLAKFSQNYSGHGYARTGAGNLVEVGSHERGM
jgi:hypothetical protein